MGKSNKKILVSIIVPIYNAEHTLRRSLDSIVGQSYNNLEVILIDDGSTDESGNIADQYARDDKRVVSYHRKHEGLSAARNYGLDNAKGSWIAFVDADDWIEENMIEAVCPLLYGIDMCCFGRSKDSPRSSIKWHPTEFIVTIDRKEALRRLIEAESIKPAIWDKFYRKELFNEIRFPVGFNYEELRTTYKLIQAAERILLIPDVFYHYTQNAGSIVHNPSPKNRLDYWTACCELYEVFSKENKEYYDACVRRCAGAISCTWGVLRKADDKESRRINELVRFAKKHRKEIRGDKKISHITRMTVLFASTGKRWSMYIAYYLNLIHKILRPESVYRRL